MVEIILTETQVVRLKAAVPQGSIEHAVLEAAGGYFSGSETTPEPIAVTVTCPMELAKRLLDIAHVASCPDVATRIRAAINQQKR